MSDETAPARIWLQTGGNYADAHEAMLGSDAGVTWCDMQQDEGDQEYVRADEIDRLRAENARLREWNAEMVAKAASGGTLDGYREMGAKLAGQEAEIDRLRAENRRMELALFEIANGPMFGPAVIAHVALSGEPDT